MRPADASGARAPGKLILSGEHSVVYGAPAIVVAIQRHMEIWFTPLHRTGGLQTVFENLAPRSFYPFDVLKGFKDSLDRRFDAFIRGDLPVQKILSRPDDLAIYTLTSLLPMLPAPGGAKGLPLPIPGQLSSHSEMPLGAGMGSSAAVVAATIVLYEHLLKLPQSAQERFQKVRFCERLQHGKGSAIDACAVVFGGLNRVQGEDVRSLTLPQDHSLAQANGWYWVLHGKPASSTGECVAQVRARHGQDRPLWARFEDCTTQLEHVLAVDDDPRAALQENQELLDHIGVVPEPAAAFARAVKGAGGAAKVSGAGSVTGDAAGAMLVYMQDPEAMAALMAPYPTMQWDKLAMADTGAALITPEPQ